jgi:hypothetical protein
MYFLFNTKKLKIIIKNSNEIFLKIFLKNSQNKSVNYFIFFFFNFIH